MCFTQAKWMRLVLRQNGCFIYSDKIDVSCSHTRNVVSCIHTRNDVSCIHKKKKMFHAFIQKRCFVHLYKKMFHAFIQKDVACIHTKRCFMQSCIHYCLWTTWINGLDPVVILTSHSRQIILTGCVAFAQHVGPRRLEEELLPQCWEQVITLSVCLSLSVWITNQKKICSFIDWFMISEDVMNLILPFTSKSNL